jgi:hypothetical protein
MDTPSPGVNPRRSCLAPFPLSCENAFKRLFEQRKRAMDFDISAHQTQWLNRVVAFMNEHIYPAIPAYEAEMNVVGADRWKVVQVVEELKKKAKPRACGTSSCRRNPAILPWTTPSSSRATSSPTSNIP